MSQSGYINAHYDTIVVGGGVIGLFCAYFLSQKGQNVLVLDKGPGREACSHANCGLISPSHINPLNDYGLILNSLLSMRKKDAPFYIKPQLKTSFLSWCFQFLRHASPKHIAKSTLAIHELLRSSRKLYEEIIEIERLNCKWSDKGIHFVFKEKKNFDHFEKKYRNNASFGVSPAPLIANELLDNEPALKDDVYGSWFYDIDASLKPDLLVDGLRNVLIAKGVSIISGKGVKSFVTNGNRITSVLTQEGGNYKADNIVLATGAWSPQLGKDLGLKIPVIPGKGYSITMKSPEIMPAAPLIMMEKKVVATPWNESFRLGSTMELAGYDNQLNSHRLAALQRGAAEYLRYPFTTDIHEQWYGWRPMTYDGVPIIDHSPVHKNLYLAVGHNMLGLSMAPGTGKLISEMIMQEETHLDSMMYAYKS